MLDEDSDVEEVYQDRGRANEYGGQERGVDLAEVSREEAVLKVVSSSRSVAEKVRDLTFAMSSVFLKPSSRRTTSPFSSNSVHRSFNSFAGLTGLPSPSSKKLVYSGRSFGSSCARCRPGRRHTLWRHDLLSLDLSSSCSLADALANLWADRLAADCVRLEVVLELASVLSARCLECLNSPEMSGVCPGVSFLSRGRKVPKSAEIDDSRGTPEPARLATVRPWDGVLAMADSLLCRLCARRHSFPVKNATPLSCARRYLRRCEDGTEALKDGAVLISNPSERLVEEYGVLVAIVACRRNLAGLGTTHDDV